MSTSTLSFCWSGLTSTISPSKSESGPDVTLTVSPSEYSTVVRGRSAVATPVCRIRSTSPCDSGTGLAPAPTKPVTPGVFLTTGHAHDDRALDHLLLPRPLDLAQLAPGLRQEVGLARLGRVNGRLGHRSRHLALRARRAVARRIRLRPALAALVAGLSRHYLVSR